MKINKTFAVIVCVAISLFITAFCRLNAVYSASIPEVVKFLGKAELKYQTFDVIEEWPYSISYYSRATARKTYSEFEKTVEDIVREKGMKELRFVPFNPYLVAETKDKVKVLLYGATDDVFDNYYKNLLTAGGELTAESVFISETFSDKYSVGDKMPFDLGDKKIDATVAGFIEKDTLALIYEDFSADEMFANMNGLAVMAIGSIFDMDTHIFDYSLNMFDISCYCNSEYGEEPYCDVNAAVRQFSSYIAAHDGIDGYRPSMPDSLGYSKYVRAPKSDSFNLIMMLCTTLLFFVSMVLYFNAKSSAKFTALLCGIVIAATLLFTGLDCLVFSFGAIIYPPAHIILTGFLISLAVAAVIVCGKIACVIVKKRGVYARLERRLADENK